MNKKNKWAFLDELDEPIEKSEVRGYIDSFEENKNLIMALKNSADLGTVFEIPLADGSFVVIGKELASGVIERILEIEKPVNREAFTSTMRINREEFIKGIRILNS